MNNYLNIDDHEQGVCPKCGCTDITYSAIELDGESVYYPAVCDECGAHFNEVYSLTFAGHYNID